MNILDPFVKNKLMLVSSNPDSGWIKEVIHDNEKRKDPKHPQHDDYNPAISCFVWETALNRYLPPDFIDNNSKGKPDWWIKKFLKGSMEHSEGMVYPNFGSTVIDDIPDFDRVSRNWERFVTLDHGLRNPTAVNFYAVEPETGVIYQYAEYYQPGTLVPEHAKALKPMVEAIPNGLLRFMVADPSICNKTDPVKGKSVQALYQEYGLYFRPGNNDIAAGILKVNSYIERGRLKVFRSCVNTIKEGLHYKFPELSMDDDKNLDEKPVKKNDHSMDSKRYGFMLLPDDPDLLKTVAHEPPTRYNKRDEPDFGDEDDYEDEPKGDFLSYI